MAPDAEDHVTVTNTNIWGRAVLVDAPDGPSVSYSYDVSDRLVQIKKGINVQATYTYNGDGNRVKAEVGSTTTTYISNYLEWTGSTATMKRYYSSGQRVAMREGSSTLYFLRH